jgi:hypothetical protein
VNSFDNIFDDDGGNTEWPNDLPTEEEAREKPTSIFGLTKLRALARLRDENVEEFLDLITDLASAANDAQVTPRKIEEEVKRRAQKMRREDDDGAEEDSVATKILKWLEMLIVNYFVDDPHRRPFIDYRDPETHVFTCRPVLHDDVADLINTCPMLNVAPPEAVVSAVVRTLATRCRRSRNRRVIHVRRGWHDDVLYLDRAATDGSVIRVDATGFKVISLQDCPLRFMHDIGLAELPVPVTGGSLSDLWNLIRVKRQQDRHITLGFLAGCYAMTGPYSGLGIYGDYGSTKTMTREFIAALFDPSAVDPGGMSDSEENTIIYAQRAALLQFDNLNELNANQSCSIRISARRSCRPNGQFSPTASSSSSPGLT